MSKRTNYFVGFEHKPAHYEDQLTRAFVVLLRLVPPVQAAFIDHVREAQFRDRFAEGDMVPPRSDLGSPMASMWTQKGDLGKDSGRILSILLTNERGLSGSTDATPRPVKPSDRTAVYDGVVHYGDDWVFIIENKPYGDVREDQLDPAIGADENWEVVEQAVRLAWKGLIQRLHNLRESGVLGPTQQLLVDDFLAFVHDKFSGLYPYPTLSSCQGRGDLLQRRCADILREVAPDHVESHRRWMDHIAADLGGARMIGLSLRGEGSDATVRLELHPGDTVSQAKSLYRNLDRAALRALHPRWECEPNLHFAHISTHLFWAQAAPDLDDYLEFWQAHRQEWVKQVPEADFGALIAVLSENGFMNEDDRQNFRKHFEETKRSTVNVCPGMSMYYRWPLEDAIKLDERGAFKDAVAERVAEAVGVWHAEGAWRAVVAARADSTADA